MTLFREHEDNELKRTDIERKDVIKKLNNIRCYLINLLNHDKRQKFINELICMLSNDDVQFDEKPYLFSFNNKIFDLQIGCFIDPKPDQYISLTTRYNYIDQNETENIEFVNNIIDTIFPQPELKKLYLTILSTGLDGIPLEKLLMVEVEVEMVKGY